MIYENCKIYGPYFNKVDNRQNIIIVFPDKTRKTISYAKYLMEKNIDRYLIEDETVDHIDRNPLNNDIDNLRILSFKEHLQIDSKRLVAQEFVCSECGNTFILDGYKLGKAIGNRKQNKSGPFCNKVCAGKYSRKRQLNKIDKNFVVLIEPNYTTLKEMMGS